MIKLNSDVFDELSSKDRKRLEYMLQRWSDKLNDLERMGYNLPEQGDRDRLNRKVNELHDILRKALRNKAKELNKVK